MRSFASGRLFPAARQVPTQPRKYLMAYNGRSAANTVEQFVGIAGSSDNITWTKLTGDNPALASGPFGWDSTWVHAPCLLKFGQHDYRMWFDGYDGTHIQTGYATSADGIAWGKYSANPVLTRGGSGAWDEISAYFPYVFYEPADISRPFKMWYAGVAAATPNTQNLGYAYSTDGINWTKSSFNPVMSVGAGGSYDASGTIPGYVVKVGSTYNFFYQGLPHSTTPEGDTICLATFTDPEGTYTKSGSNPLLGLSTANQALTSNLALGSATVVVADTSLFHVNEPCLLFDSTLTAADVTIRSVDSGTQLTLTMTANRAWTTANTASIRSAYSGAIDGRTILPVGTGFVMYTAPFQQFGSSIVSERTAAAVSSSLTSGWSNDFTRGIVLPLGTWDGLSAENPSVIVE